MQSLDIVIAGGGIGGLCAALCLAKKGFHVRIFERADSIQDVGAGIQLSPNCTRVLSHLGMTSQLRACSYTPAQIKIRQWNTGSLIARIELGAQAERLYGFPYFQMHRADLVQALIEQALSSPNIEYNTKSEIQSFDQKINGVGVKVNGELYHTDVLIGADGIHSTVRTALFGLAPSEFTGNVAWRGIIEATDIPDDLVQHPATVWWGPRKHFVHYFVRNEALISWILVMEKSDWEIESWTQRGSYDDLMHDILGCHETIRSIVERTEPYECFKWGLFQRPPMPRWSRGYVTLLGDACHPMLPFLAQGAAMAIEDGAVLAECLEHGNDVSSSLKVYEHLRQERTTPVQQQSQRNATIFHAAGAMAWVRNQLAEPLARRRLGRQFSYNVFELRKLQRH